MPTSTCGKPVSEALLLAGLLIAAAPAAGDHRESYRRGVEAAHRESWADAMRFMRAALSEQPREGELVFLDGGRPEPYIPHYYIGLALYHTGNCVAARREWEGARAAIRRSPYLKTVARLNQECQKRAPREAAAIRSAAAVEAEIRKAEKLASAVAVLESNPQVADGDREELQKALREARERLADSRARLDQGRRDADPGDIAKAREMAERATADIEKARRRAMSGFDPFATAPAGAPPPVTRAPARPPDRLVSAAHAYFEGRYEDVVAMLADPVEWSGAAMLQAHLLRAAARHALYLLGGSQDEALRRDVTSDVEAVRRMDPTFQPDPSAFSPRFRRLFE